jgi:hypothetical protein
VRAHLILLLIAVLAAACSAVPAVAPEPGEELLDHLRAEVATVAEAQARADRELNHAVDAIRRLDESVAALGNTEGFDDRLAAHGELHAIIVTIGVDGLRQAWLDVADRVATARDLVAGTRTQLADDAWAQAYLDAQDAVLLALHDYAREADRLAQLVQQHWSLFVDIDARIADFATRRSRFRNVQEARDALAVELDRLIRPLVVAEGQIADQLRVRRAAADQVNAATADAVTIYEQGPEAFAVGTSRG